MTFSARPTARTGPKIYLVHAGAISMEPATAAFKEFWPEATLANVLDESLAMDLVEAGHLDHRLVERFCSMGRHCADGGADAILFTCSAFGAAIDAVKRSLPIPVLSPNEAMFEEVAARGGRCAVLTTFPASTEPLAAELQAMAAARNSRITVESHFVEGAIEALLDGAQERHDSMISATASSLRGYDSIVLGQFSMAAAHGRASARSEAPVYCSPASAVRKLKRLLSSAASAPAPPGGWRKT